MKNFKLPRLILLAAGLCIAGASSYAAPIVNGSFETEDFSGWTLEEWPSSADPDAGIWGNVASGTTIDNNTPVFDHFDGEEFTSRSEGLPHTFTATDGNRVVIQLQNGSQIHRMFQDITLPSDATTLCWDMYYNNLAGLSEPGQVLEVNLRDSSDDLLVTLFTSAGGPESLSGMLPFSGDVSAFAGSTVRLSVEMDVEEYYFDAAFDNFRINGPCVPDSTATFSLLAFGMVVLAGFRRKLFGASA